VDVSECTQMIPSVVLAKRAPAMGRGSRVRRRRSKLIYRWPEQSLCDGSVLPKSF
jgi:hypothetical protein